MKTMKAAVIQGPHNIVLQEVPYPTPGPGQVVVKVEACGVCGTDYHILEGDFLSSYPLIAGHEFSGTIHELGPGVEHWQLAERVAVDPSVYCGECYYCLNNQGNMCQNWNAIGVTLNGAFAEYVVVPAKNLYRLPDTMSFQEGAFVEPLSCVVYAMRRLNIRFGDKVLLFGSGPMGLLLMQSILKGGASEVVVVDRAEDKLTIARQLGAHKTFAGTAGLREEYPLGFDVVIDATGVPAVIENMFQYAGNRAKIMQFGCAPREAKVSVSPFDIYNKDWEILGTMALLFTFYPAIHLLKNGVVVCDPLTTAEISLDDFPAYLSQPKGSKDLKVLVRPWKK
ncbi:zinc-dependent alcohol dehydrogenase family protein [Desulforamulus ruminis]|uniref:Alcohol dehydrogenase GroES domain protein n=1 Tax=Desulforamulus ruminis (strain ATCC 23193 / DSM 2154 / NCIMB 8452 / DL) TaxID=696281 RepID=F6DUU7_DESRL|nr:zinc-dependent alcohol dehydrogenase family protein [Desulforamulus ruminis]AEG61344.1 Alcohol dehydrogenase GroES domain protein [Desulforamulus ruminis DSM 2154]